jgi:hypothetical protein
MESLGNIKKKAPHKMVELTKREIVKGFITE